MMIIGADYHPGFQQIAFVDTDTGELQERRLQHREEAEQFYRDLAAQGMRVRVGMEASGHARWFERLLSELQFPQSARTDAVGTSYPSLEPVDSTTPRSAPLSRRPLLRHSSFVRAVCVDALVRICAGGDQRWSSLPRQLSRRLVARAGFAPAFGGYEPLVLSYATTAPQTARSTYPRHVAGRYPFARKL
jgi:hypothetical protein